MKHSLMFLSVVFFSTGGWTQSPKNIAQPNTSHPDRASDLRLVLQQQPPTGPEGMRRLSPEQRAELRRQVVQFSKTSGKR